MNKLPHDILREVAATTLEIAIRHTDGKITILDRRTELDTLADEIEKYYIPRPRFEDGEPVQGDRLFNSPIDYYYVYNDGSWVVYLVDDNGEDNGELSGHASDFVRLPESKVLDADGIEIKVGDTVWVKNSPFEPLLVSGFKDGRVLMSYHNETSLGYKPTSLTHCKPDSLEKLRDDSTKSPRQYYADFIGHDVGLIDDEEINSAVHKHIIDRAVAIMERDI